MSLTPDAAERLIHELRLHACALAGDSALADPLVEKALMRLMDGEAQGLPLRMGLFRAFHDAWRKAGTPGADSRADFSQPVDWPRAAWLLRKGPGFSLAEIGCVLRLDPAADGTGKPSRPWRVGGSDGGLRTAPRLKDREKMP